LDPVINLQIRKVTLMQIRPVMRIGKPAAKLQTVGIGAVLRVIQVRAIPVGVQAIRALPATVVRRAAINSLLWDEI
jgi:hypothetical protein